MMSLHRVDGILFAIDNWNDFYQGLPSKMVDRTGCDTALIDKARVIGADAVIKVTYQSGIGFTTWGYMDAKGTGIKFVE